MAFSAPAFSEGSGFLLDSPTLTNDWFGAGPAMRDAGVDLRLEASQFYQGLVEGDDDDSDWRYGGKLDAQIRVDLSKWGFWDGLSATVQATYNYGSSVNYEGGTHLPVNIASYFPGEDGDDRFDWTAFYLTQAFGDRVSVSLGKFNLIEFARGAPLRGGGGVDTFWNAGIATPISGLSPPTIFGAMASINTQPVSFTLFVFDSRDATNRDVFDDPFSEGVNFMGSATYATRIACRSGFYGIRGIYSTKEGLDFRDIQELLLPPEAQNINTKMGSWYLGVSFQQFLIQDPTNPAIGWGVFGEAGISDGNPNILDWMAYIGVGGSSFIPGRAEADRFGIAYFRYGLSGDLKDGLDGVFDLEDESGIEMFYRVGLTPWLQVSADLQFIDPASGEFGDDIFAGVRTNVRF